MQLMQLGNFSVCLRVKDIEASQQFYGKLGFASFGGDASNGWLILENGDVVIGLFQGMFERNMLTFDPGWDGNAQPLEPFTDVRDLQRRMKAQGVALASEADGWPGECLSRGRCAGCNPDDDRTEAGTDGAGRVHRKGIVSQ